MHIASSFTDTFFSGLGWLIYVIWIVLVIAGTWKTFVKAGKPGWGAIIPFYNTYLMIKVAGRPGWWLILFFIPIVNVIMWLIVALGIAENFGHGAGTASCCGCSLRSCSWCSASAATSTSRSGLSG